MTREEKQKAIDALKISTPIMAVTEEYFNAYIQTLNTIMDWLEQEPCEDAISRQAVLDCLTASGLKKFDFILNARDKVKKLPPVTPQEPKTDVLDKIKAEIDSLEWWCNGEDFFVSRKAVLEVIERVMESEG